MRGTEKGETSRIGRLGLVMLLSVGLVGCANMSADQKALACGGAILGGTLLGAHLGDSNGAIVGAAVGGAACAVILDVAHKKDQARLAAAQKQAALTNRSSKKTFTTQTGKKATVVTKVEPRPKPTKLSDSLFKSVSDTETASAKPKQEYCRYVSQSVSIEGQSADLGGQMWCATNGDFKPYKGGL